MLDKRDQKPPVGNHAHPQYLTTAVTSLKKTGGTSLTGNVELAEGANIILTQDDVLKKITITADSASTFLALTDTLDTYVGQSGKSVIVNATEDGLIFGAASGEGGVNSSLTDLDMYNNGMISTYSDTTVYDWNFTKNIDGRIDSITNNTLLITTTITWNAGDKL